MVRTVRTAKRISLAALILAFLAMSVNTISNAKFAQDNCEAIEDSRAIQYRQRQFNITQAEHHQFDKVYQSIYGPTWEKELKAAIDRAKKDVAEFEPRKCGFPIFGFLT